LVVEMMVMSFSRLGVAAEGLVLLDIVVRMPHFGFVTAAIVVNGGPRSGLGCQSANTSRLS
jgi:hypothetical protein